MPTNVLLNNGSATRVLPQGVSALLAGLLLFLLPGPASAESAGGVGAPDRPNIIIIFTDDMGWGDIGAFGHPTIRTPSLDRMAQEGAKLTQFYVPHPVCSPSRAALLTGRLPVRYGMAWYKLPVFFPEHTGGLPPSEVTIASVLKARGYRTALVGKWHLGEIERHGPLVHGFDLFYGTPYSNDITPSENDWGPAQYWPPLPFYENETVLETDPDQRTLTKRYTEKTLHLIEEHRDRPFFIYLAHNMPHIPLYASGAFRNTSKRGLYGDVIEELDWSVGQILNKLRDLGLERKTLVLFTSDNGPWVRFNLRGGSAGMLRDGKGTCWEGGVRVPAVAWFPGTIEANTVVDEPASTLDLFPTVASLSGSPVPEDRIYDGQNMLPLLKGTSLETERLFCFYRGEHLYAVRKGPWKLHFRSETIRDGQTEVTVHDPPVLFNVDLDPAESLEISAVHPELVAELVSLAEEHRGTYRFTGSQLQTIPEDKQFIYPWAFAGE